MSIHTNTHIECERVNCHEKYNMGHFGKKVGSRTIRKAAREIGWTHTDGKDFCPQHKMVRKTVLVPAG